MFAPSPPPPKRPPVVPLVVPALAPEVAPEVLPNRPPDWGCVVVVVVFPKRLLPAGALFCCWPPKPENMFDPVLDDWVFPPRPPPNNPPAGFGCVVEGVFPNRPPEAPVEPWFEDWLLVPPLFGKKLFVS